jgi:hypothetical protein
MPISAVSHALILLENQKLSSLSYLPKNLFLVFYLDHRIVFHGVTEFIERRQVGGFQLFIVPVVLFGCDERVSIVLQKIG